MIRASIDIGSNSCLLLIADVDAGKIEVIEDQARITSLGKGIDKTGKLSKRSMAETIVAFNDYYALIKKYGLDSTNILVTATEASRVASNSLPFFQEIKKRFNFNVKLISGEGEAYYTSLGVCSINRSQKKQTIMDIGGGSTELIRVTGEPFNLDHFISLPLGSVRGKDWLLEGSFMKKIEEIMNSHNLETYYGEEMICVAGTMTSLGAISLDHKEYNRTLLDNSEINFETFSQLVDSLQSFSTAELTLKYPFLGKRAETIFAGGLIGYTIGKKLGAKKLIISTRGLRFGTVLAGEIYEHFIIK